MDDYTMHGGPAFPFEFDQMGERSAVAGMTLRDWFAGQALGYLAMNAMDENRGAAMHGGDSIPITTHDVAEKAYAFADAMLEARKR